MEVLGQFDPLRSVRFDVDHLPVVPFADPFLSHVVCAERTTVLAVLSFPVMYSEPSTTGGAAVRTNHRLHSPQASFGRDGRLMQLSRMAGSALPSP